MTDAWDERTEAIPGTKDDKSFELDFDFGDSQDLAPTHETQALGRLNVVVFEPSPLGLSAALMRMGLAVRVGRTGVDVMSVVAEEPPGVVICAPSPDAERRRLLAAALRLRFPHVPIIYVSTHAAQEDAVLGALREGARAVLAWPLPSSTEVVRVLEPFLGGGDTDVRRVSSQVDTAPTPKVRGGPASEEDSSFDAIDTIVTADGPLPVALPQHPPRPPVARASRPGHDFMVDDPTTQPNMRPAPVGPAEALVHSRGEIGELLAAVSPFLWSLEDASRWAAELGSQGDLTAANHARTLMLLAKILGQLQARIDDLGA